MAAPFPRAGWPAGARGRVVAAPAKVNLFLELLGKRSDGYHDLRTLVAPIDLYDTLEIRPRDDDRIVLTCDAPGIPTGDRNLVWKVADALRKANSIAAGATIHLTKRIPHEAGLGGGSSDAASALRALNAVWNRNKSLDELTSIAARIGSDVAAFLHDGPTWCIGRGEVAVPIASPIPLDLVIVKPPFGLSTAEVYRSAHLVEAPVDGGAICAALAAGDAVAVGRLMHNRLQPSAFALQPLMDWVYEALLAPEPLGAMLSGSGSCVFALARNRPDALRIARRTEMLLAPKIPDCRLFVVRTLVGNSDSYSRTTPEPSPSAMECPR